jgi:hypothetical protein
MGGRWFSAAQRNCATKHEVAGIAFWIMASKTLRL